MCEADCTAHLGAKRTAARVSFSSRGAPRLSFQSGASAYDCLRMAPPEQLSSNPPSPQRPAYGMAQLERPRRSPLQAVIATILALIALNVVAAYVLARTAGMRGFDLAPTILWGLLLLGVGAAIVAAVLWRRYLASSTASDSAAAGPPKRREV